LRIVKVDTRTAVDYAKSHIRNSVNIGLIDIVRTQLGLPAMCISQDIFEQVLGSRGIDNGTHVIVYDNFGHDKMSVFDGSIKGWIDEGGAFTSEVPTVKKAHFAGEVDETRLATKEWILDHLEDDRTTFLDVRTVSEFYRQDSIWQAGRTHSRSCSCTLVRDD
jgi:thiosulfate/3-mercaptopyruvate sulfurtransferase